MAKDGTDQMSRDGQRHGRLGRTSALPGVALLFLGLSAILLCWSAAAFADVKVGDTPPDYLGIDQRKEHVRISNHRGRVVVTTFWASWCGPCLNEMPILEKMQKAAGHDRMVVVGINMNEPLPRYRMVLNLLQSSPISLLRDDGRLAEKFGVKSIPHVLMIDKAGKVAHIHKGYDESAMPGFLDEINALLLAPYEPAMEE